MKLLENRTKDTAKTRFIFTGFFLAAEIAHRIADIMITMDDRMTIMLKNVNILFCLPFV